VAPPTITLVVNYPELFTPNYLRFLMNRFRDELPFPEVPIRIVIRARRQKEDEFTVSSKDLDKAGPRRIARGRLKTKSTSDETFGPELLLDSESQIINIDAFSNDPADYFEDDEA
jgi:hypothetical protein